MILTLLRGEQLWADELDALKRETRTRALSGVVFILREVFAKSVLEIDFELGTSKVSTPWVYRATVMDRTPDYENLYKYYLTP